MTCFDNSNGQVCWALKYASGSTLNGQIQEVQTVASGLTFNFPVVMVGYARRTANHSSDLTNLADGENDWVATSKIFASGAAWFYRGIGLFCERNGREGFQDPRAENTECGIAASTEDCVIAGVSATVATWETATVSNSSSGDRYWTQITDTKNVYRQKCHFKGSTNTDPIVSGVPLKDGTLKCDITIDKLAQNGQWVLATSNQNVWSLASLSACPVEKQFVGLQVWVFAGSASTTVGSADTANNQQLRMDGATTLKWTRTVSCTYADGSSQQSNVVADSRLVTNPFADWKDATLTGSVSRINFAFQCPRTNGAGSLLDKIYWDPETDTDPRLVPVSAASLRFSTLVLALALFLAGLL